MNEEQLEDLKRFIAVTVSQAETHLREELATKTELHAMEERMTKEMRDGFAGVGDALESQARILDEHEHRIAGLEQAA